KPEEFEQVVITMSDLALMQKLAIAVELRLPAIVEGGTGIGKTTLLSLLSAHLNADLYYVNCGNFSIETIIGDKTISEGTKSGFGWVDGLLLTAIKNGGIFIADEIDFMPHETRARLHEITDHFLRGRNE